MPYRLHIDIPLEMGEEEARIASIQILGLLADHDDKAIILNAIGIQEINYRLGHDDDRQKSNYLIKNENGHVNNKKSKIVVPKMDQIEALQTLTKLDEELDIQ
jgi:hypothetical protein